MNNYESFNFQGEFVFAGDHWVVNVFRDETDWCVDATLDANRTILELFESLQED